MLVIIAATKPTLLKLNSVAEHKARPLMIGNNEAMTNGLVYSP